jgi:hypothetical protein
MVCQWWHNMNERNWRIWLETIFISYLFKPWFLLNTKRDKYINAILCTSLRTLQIYFECCYGAVKPALTPNNTGLPREITSYQPFNSPRLILDSTQHKIQLNESQHCIGNKERKIHVPCSSSRKLWVVQMKVLSRHQHLITNPQSFSKIATSVYPW